MSMKIYFCLGNHTALAARSTFENLPMAWATAFSGSHFVPRDIELYNSISLPTVTHRSVPRVFQRFSGTISAPLVRPRPTASGFSCTRVGC